MNSELPVTSPTTRVTHTTQTLTVIATATYTHPKNTVAYRARIQKHRNRDHVDVTEWKQYPGLEAFSEWSETLVGGGGLFERELRYRVFEAAVREFENEIKTYD